jgi:hypothetical protein
MIALSRATADAQKLAFLEALMAKLDASIAEETDPDWTHELLVVRVRLQNWIDELRAK